MRETTGTNQHFYRAIYISTGEGVSDAQRAYRMNQMFEARRRIVESGGTGDTDSDTILSRILSRCIYNEEEFHEWLYHQLPNMLATHNNTHAGAQTAPVHHSSTERIGLIVIDSMAGLFRISEDQQSPSWYVQRSGLLFQVAAQLKKLSIQYHVPIVVVNQVTSGGEHGKTIPALGLTWSHCINARYLISRKEEYFTIKDEVQQEGRTRFSRRIQLILSSQWPALECSFMIDHAGCKLIN
jgi:hypothetical protein